MPRKNTISCSGIADKLGLKDDFTEGKTQEQWIEEIYKKSAEKDGNMPTLGRDQGPGSLQA